jgi:predicted RNase H-like nuclease (RuvC/YqgF family)
MLITTYLHYRRKDKVTEDLVLSVEGYNPQDDGKELIVNRLSQVQPVTSADSVSDPNSPGEGEDPDAGVSAEEEDPQQQENMYKGILWMKEKFEQYRDLADQRYEQLKEELNRSEKKYYDLLAAMQGGNAIAPADNGEKDRRVEELEQQLQTERLKVEELAAKLQNSSQLLLNIYQELDKSLNTAAVRSGLASPPPVPIDPAV